MNEPYEPNESEDSTDYTAPDYDPQSDPESYENTQEQS